MVGVPLNYRWLAHEIQEAAADAGARGLILDMSLPVSQGILDNPGLFELIVGFNGADPRSADYESLVAEHSGLPPVWRPAWPINVIGYTSGTTGRAKGAALSSASATLVAFWFATLLELRAGDRFLGCMPAYVNRGGGGCLSPVVVGATTHMMDFEPRAVLHAIERERITHVIFAPIMVTRILELPDATDFDLRSLRSVWVGGASAAPTMIASLQELVGNVVGSLYGGTEATGIASMRWPDATNESELLASVGRPSPIVDVRLIDTEGNDVRAGEVGEVTVKGESVMLGYWPDIHGGGLSDGWYRTGDFAIRDDQGFLFLVDRREDVIISGGLNVYSAEVERTLAEHPDIVECAVVGAPDAEFGETVAACVVVRPGSQFDISTMEDFARSRIAGYKRPRKLVLFDHLPRNAMGKVDKSLLRQQLSSSA